MCKCDDEDPPELNAEEDDIMQPPIKPRDGLVTYTAEADLPLTEPPLRTGEVLHLNPDDGKSFQLVTLCLHSNGISLRNAAGQMTMSVAWSPFSLVQACRLHTVQADNAQPLLRLFKVSVFHHGLTRFFATQGGDADAERARWVADISRSLRGLTQSLFPSFCIRVEPLPGAGWTSTRLLAGYLLLYDEAGVSLVYGELHAHWDTGAGFAAYEDETCLVQVVHLVIDMHTCVSERVGIDCSCFSLGDHNFAVRTCSEKMLWLRAISNVKVKLRHWASNPTPADLRNYRSSIREHARGLPRPLTDESNGPLLPQRRGTMSRLPRAHFASEATAAAAASAAPAHAREAGAKARAAPTSLPAAALLQPHSEGEDGKAAGIGLGSPSSAGFFIAGGKKSPNPLQLIEESPDNIEPLMPSPLKEGRRGLLEGPAQAIALGEPLPPEMIHKDQGIPSPRPDYVKEPQVTAAPGG